MQVMLAEDIGGWILAGCVLFGGIALSILALGALIPAWKGHRAITLVLATPAFVFGVIATGWLIHNHLNTPSVPSYYARADFVATSMFMAGPSLVTSLLSVTVLWYKRRTKRNPDMEATAESDDR